LFTLNDVIVTLQLSRNSVTGTYNNINALAQKLSVISLIASLHRDFGVR